MSGTNKKSWVSGLLIGSFLLGPAAAAEVVGLRVMLRPDAPVVPALRVEKVTGTGALETRLPAGLAEYDVRAAISALRKDPAVLWVQPILAAQATDKHDQPVLGRRLVIRLKSDAAKIATIDAEAVLLASWEKAGGQPLRILRRGGADSLIVETAAATDLQRLAAAIEADPAVLYADPMMRMFPLRAPSDPLFALQWNYSDAVSGINAPAAWDITTGGAVTVAVVDTGLLPHPDLVNKALPGYDMISDPEIALDNDGRDDDAFDSGDWIEGPQCGSEDPIWEASSWHGTHVAGIIGAQANNGQGIAGVSWGARILPVRVLGRCGGEFADVMDGVLWAAGVPVAGAPVNPYPAKVINLSLGGKGACPRAMQQAIDAALLRGVSVVVAAGNANRDTAGYAPANCGGVITVAAHNVRGDKAYYSNFGPLVEISAPGGEFWSFEGVLSTISDGPRSALAFTYGEYQGTSMAAPHVAGAIALALTLNPQLRPSEFAELLASTARRHPEGSSCASDTPCGSGMLDVAAFLVAVPSPTPVEASLETVQVREFHNSVSGRYLITANAEEAAALLAGVFGSGWQATGFGFNAFPSGAYAPSSSWPVCRLYGETMSDGGAHFFTASPFECAVISRTEGWQYEGLVFRVGLPTLGLCDRGFTPVFRLYDPSGRFGHRYVAEANEYARTIESGWSGEGISMCAPLAPTVGENATD